MKHSLDRMDNSLTHNIQDDELYLKDGWCICDRCGEKKEQYLKDREICLDCYTSDKDYYDGKEDR